MRAYPIDSPQAAGRLLAMALVADGHCSPSELKTLDRLAACERLGLAPEAMKSVIDAFIEDLSLQQRGHWQGSAGMAAEERARLLDEVRHPMLRAEVRRLCEAIVLADGHLDDSEVNALDEMAFAWREEATSATASVRASLPCLP